MHSINKSYLFLFFSILICLLTTRCAIQVAPGGGPIDNTPPFVKESTPPNYSTLFKENKIRIYFNEYIEMKDMMNQITISPIPETDPDISVKGKSLQVEFYEKLRDSITYTINFGNSICDYTVGNVFSNYKYIFSTAQKLDTSEIKGSVLDAFTLKPIDNCFVMIYDLNVDSLPLKVKPLYFSRTDKSGQFEINYIRNGKYKIFALIDANSNYLYDLPNESIAFMDTLVVSRIRVKPKTKSLKDTTLIKKDTLLTPDKKIIIDPIKIRRDSLLADSVRKDSLISDSTSKTNLYKLFLFNEKDTIQQLLKATITEEVKISFIFKQGVKDLQIKPLNINYDTIWKLDDYNPTHDTIVYWLLKVKTDSLILQVSENGKIIDTAEFKLGKQKTIPGKGTPISPKVNFKVNFGSEGFDYYKPLVLSSSTPLIKYDLNLIKLMVKKDTLQDTLKFSVHFSDSIKKVLQVDYKWEEGKNYTLFIPKGAFKDIHNNINDTLIIPFKTKTFNDYGTMLCNIILPDSSGKCSYIVQLLNDKEKVLNEKPLKISSKIKYDFLDPGTYRIKVIKDSNGNGKWDTGNYKKKLLPEKVYYFPIPIIIKAGWDITDQVIDLYNMAH